MSDQRNTAVANDSVPSDQLDLSTLVGHDLTIFSRQFPGKALQSKIVVVTANSLSVDRSGSGGQIDSLVNNQRVTVNLNYKNQPISVSAVLKRSSGGRCNILLDDKVTVLTRRRFQRANLLRPAKFAVIPTMTANGGQIPKLRWLASSTRDISSGGALLQLTSILEARAYLLINIDLEDFPLPSLIIGQVRYTFSTDGGKIATGVEFIVKEDKDKHSSVGIIGKLPPVVFEYSSTLRERVNEKIKAWMHESDSNNNARSTQS